MASEMVTASREATQKFYGRSGAALGFAYAIFGAVTQEIGDAIFGLALAGNSLLYEYAISPREAIERFRTFCQQCDRYARTAVVIAAIGGTALVVDAVFYLSLLNQYIDPWAKRAGLPILFLAGSLFVTAWISNKIYSISMVEGDGDMRRIELPFYVMTALFILTNFAFFLGMPLEDFIPSCKDPNYADQPGCRDPNVTYYDAPNWATFAWKIILTFNLISFVWSAAMFLCLLSRYFECRGRLFAMGLPMTVTARDKHTEAPGMLAGATQQGVQPDGPASGGSVG
ncbi:MAG: hypothetical protein V4709_06320 [Pseudomonadota bacterium]